MSSRRLSDWISAYLKYTENTEPPLSYHTWVGISLIAGALQRRTYIKWGYETIYPNMYIVLVGPSGKCRKGTAMTIGRNMIESIGIPITSESTTREALIRDMKDALASYTDPSDGAIKFHCSLTCHSEELSVFLGQNDLSFLSNLTDWFDSRDSWTYRTKGAGTDAIQGVCFNLLGATAPDWLQSIIPEEAVGGGFTSRIIFIVEDNKGKTVPDHRITKEEQQLEEWLKEDLARIVNMAGPFTFDDEGREMYIDWYIKSEEDIKNNKAPIPDPRFAGYCDRRATHIRKLSMIMSASRGDSMIITGHDFNRALSVLRRAEINMAGTFGGLGQSQYSDVTEKVLKFIISRGEVTRSALLQLFYRDIDPMTLRVVEELLDQMKVIQIFRNPMKGDVIYRYVGRKND